MLSNCLASPHFLHILLRKFIKALKKNKPSLCIILFEYPLSVWVDHGAIAKCVDLFRSDKNMLDISGFKCCLCLIEPLAGVGFGENRQLSQQILMFIYMC